MKSVLGFLAAFGRFTGERTMPDVMKIKEAEGVILDILRRAKKPLATRAIEEKVQGQGRQCPDSAVKFLAKMRYRGLIKGELSREHGGWVWWVDKVS